jgi:hypothetical protein
MRKTFFRLLALVAVAFSIASPAEAGHKLRHVKKPIVVGAVVGTVVGVGLYNGWFGSSSLATVSTSAAGAATVGMIAGVATVTTIHALTTPCTGFHAVFAGKGCKNGKYVGKHKHAHLFW